MATPELSVLMPVYNEATTIARAIEQVLAAELPIAARELVVVDDRSTDGTREWLLAQEWPAEMRLVLHDRNRGKGAAVRTALEHARGTYATVMDADLEYDCLLYTSPSPRDLSTSRMPSSA